MMVFAVNIMRCANQRFRIQRQYNRSGEIVIAPAYFDSLTDSERDRIKINRLLSRIGRHLRPLIKELREYEMQSLPVASQPQAIGKFLKLRGNKAERLLDRNQRLERLLERLEPISEKHYEGVKQIVDGHPLYGHTKKYTSDDMADAEDNLAVINRVLPHLDNALVELNRRAESEPEPINNVAYQRLQVTVERVRTIVVRLYDAAEYALRDRYGRNAT